MKQTDVIHKYEDTSSDPTGSYELVSTDVSCRLFSVQFKIASTGAGHKPEVLFIDGGLGGTERLRIGSSQSVFIPPVAIPTHGIRFDEGIRIERGGTGSGIDSITITYQGS